MKSAFLRKTSPLIALTACACTGEPASDASHDDVASYAPVSIMAFNVQNLFDNVDDPGKDDKAYLPLAAKQDQRHIDACNAIDVESWRDECLNLDWNDDAVAFKLTRIAAAIRQTPAGTGPDIIALQEVENVDILERLRTEYLPDSGYLPAILIEGEDLRGIDVAFLSRLPLAVPATLHPVEFPEHPDRQGDTRGVLEATFELPDGSLLTGYSVHFPAPFHPTEMRVVAYEHLNGLKATLPDDRAVFAAGDFNTPSREVAADNMLERFAYTDWTVAHERCVDPCPGTNYWARGDSWSFLDMIFYSPGTSSWQIRNGSVHIANAYAPQVTGEGTPARFRLAERSGVSDHWPLVMTLERVSAR